MAKYDVNFSCGHKCEIELFGKHDDRYKKIEYYEQHGLCPDCYKKSKDRAIDDKIARFGDLPQLVGSEKQINWANDIRRKALVKVLEWINDQPNGERGIELVKAGLAIATSAKWWIDHRDTLDGLTWARNIAQATKNADG